MAFLKGSRYADLPRFDTASPFEGVRPRPIGTATPVLEHTVAMKERLDGLAQEFYRNPRTWFRLAEANLAELFAEDLIWQPEPAGEDGREKLGQVILVPRRE
ncbi:MAG: hypothetical protein OEM24_12960, partial [Paracoccaceae bacterium]|nr:hypothetical protein [Paracoccaceae bacterium]